MIIDYFCFTNSTGYSFAAQNNIKALNLLGCKVNVLSINEFNNKHVYFGQKYILYHCIPEMQKNVKTSIKSIGYATYETEDPPDNWIKILNKNEYVIVPSIFNKTIFEKCLKTKILYVPHCLDFTEFDYKIEVKRRFENTFNFLAIGTWKERKNYKELIKAFLYSFKSNEATLTIKTSGINSKAVYLLIKEIAAKLNVSYDHVFVNTINLNNKELPGFIKSFDCLVNPTLGEGFGLPGLQAMSLKIPTIITAYSGTTEYANEKTAYTLIPEGFTNKSMDGIYQFKNRKWPIISYEQVSQKMKQVLVSEEERRYKVENAYEHVIKRFNYNTAIQPLIQVLRD